MNFEEKVTNIIKSVNHPAINHSLFDLGIIKDFEIKENNVKIIFAFPALNIPIKDMLINSLKYPLEEIGCKFDFDIQVMTPEEMNKFLKMEASGWKGL